jgi:hypothetical protein
MRESIKQTGDRVSRRSHSIRGKALARIKKYQFVWARQTGIHVLPHVKYNGYRKGVSQMTGTTQLKASHSLNTA